MKFKSIDKATCVCLLGGLILLAYTSTRALELSMTHDESSTFLNGMGQSVWLCFFSETCWATANMHWLNTFLMQLSVGLFGTEAIFVRLPNLLAHLLYLIYSFALLRGLSGRFWLVFMGFVLLNANPYMIEFFSVSRGYGLALAFLVMSFYYLWRWLEGRQLPTIVLCFACAGLAVLSNFIFLNYLVALLGLFAFNFLHNLLINKSLPRGKEHIGPLLTGLLISGILAILLYVPIRALRKLGEFEYGAESIIETIRLLVLDSLAQQGYLGPWTGTFFLVLAFGGTLCAVAFGWWKWFKEGRQRSLSFYPAIAILASGLFLGLVLQYQLLGTRYLMHRTSIILVPFWGILCFCFFNEINRFPRILTVWVFIIAAFASYHFFRTANIDNFCEWEYDSRTKQMMSFLKESTQGEKEVKLGVFWLYSHSANFYRKTWDVEALVPIVYEKQLKNDLSYGYYYIEPGQESLIHQDYILVKDFGVGRLYVASTLLGSDNIGVDEPTK